jgi:Flp pilus assembly pilin Flp
MHEVMKLVAGRARSECGQTMAEYVLIISAVAVAVMSAYFVTGNTLLGIVNGIARGF